MSLCVYRIYRIFKQSIGLDVFSLLDTCLSNYHKNVSNKRPFIVRINYHNQVSFVCKGACDLHYSYAHICIIIIYSQRVIPVGVQIAKHVVLSEIDSSVGEKDVLIYFFMMYNDLTESLKRLNCKE